MLCVREHRSMLRQGQEVPAFIRQGGIRVPSSSRNRRSMTRNRCRATGAFPLCTSRSSNNSFVVSQNGSNSSARSLMRSARFGSAVPRRLPIHQSASAITSCTRVRCSESSGPILR
jgi:hypothetical protein